MLNIHFYTLSDIVIATTFWHGNSAKFWLSQNGFFFFGFLEQHARIWTFDNPLLFWTNVSSGYVIFWLAEKALKSNMAAWMRSYEVKEKKNSLRLDVLLFPVVSHSDIHLARRATPSSPVLGKKVLRSPRILREWREWGFIIYIWRHCKLFVISTTKTHWEWLLKSFGRSFLNP